MRCPCENCEVREFMSRFFFPGDCPHKCDAYLEWAAEAMTEGEQHDTDTTDSEIHD